MRPTRTRNAPGGRVFLLFVVETGLWAAMESNIDGHYFLKIGRDSVTPSQSGFDGVLPDRELCKQLKMRRLQKNRLLTGRTGEHWVKARGAGHGLTVPGDFASSRPWIFAGKMSVTIQLHIAHGFGFMSCLETAMQRERVTNLYSGHVQGVGFRYAVKALTTGYEVTGTVRNLPDGRVELVAESAKEELEAFLQAVRESEVGRFIRQEQARWSGAKNEFRGFEISG